MPHVILRLGAHATKLACALFLVFSFVSCGSADEREAVAYWRSLRTKSVEISAGFLDAVAEQDSAAIAESATDSVVAIVSRLRREASANALIAAARQFPARKKNVRVFGTGASVTFTYEYEGQEQRAEVVTGFHNNRLLVTDFATQAWVD